jgi:hypothetical protein
MTAAAGLGCACQLTRAAVAWAAEELMVAALHGRPLLTDVIDQVPAGQAQIVVALCLRAGGRLEHGDEALFQLAVKDAMLHDPAATGWWREALAGRLPAAARPAKATNTRH